MEDKLKKFKNAIESKPKYLVEQRVIMPIFSFDLNGEIDADSVTQRAMPLRKSNSESFKPDLVKNGYQTNYIKEIDTTLFADLNKIIEDKCRIAFKQNYKATDYWFVFYEEGGEIISHSHYNLKRYKMDATLEIYPLASAYYPLCSEKSSPIIFNSHVEGMPDVVVPIKKNTLLIFNANLYHYVPKSTESDLRLVYSCNLYARN
jgi:hypothetical protein